VIAARIIILGAGFGGLELATLLSDALGEDAGVTLIDASSSFVFGYAKLDVMFGRKTLDEVRVPYSAIDKPGVRFIQERIIEIDPTAKRILTDDGGIYEADFLVIALGADYDFDATPGLAEATEFYSVAGAARLRELLPSFTSGRAMVGVCGAPFKCPPAPSEAALMLHDYLIERGHRDACEVIESGLAVDGFIPVDSATLATGVPGIYAVGDVTTVGVPKAGVFAEGAAKVVAAGILAELQDTRSPAPYAGQGSCYIEFGAGRIGRVDVDFFGGPKPTGAFQAPSVELAAEKREFGETRRARWFGL
jgi:NADH dehydrogenase FAD-containing subunit